jgi:thiol-disulfide isomerase/thioredoxin
MKYLLVCALVLLTACKNEANSNELALEAYELMPLAVNQDLEIYDYDGLEPLINKKDDKVHVVNFWATWCAPCVKELPYFEKINEKYKNAGVEVLLVSLDFPSNYDTNLKPFIKKRQLQSKVIALDDTNQNRWIPAINKDWSGAIPATIIYNNEKRKFYEKSFSLEELETELKQFLKS